MSVYTLPDWNLILGEEKAKDVKLSKEEAELLDGYDTVWKLTLDIKDGKNQQSLKRLKNMIVASLGVVYLHRGENLYLFFLPKVIGQSTPEAYFTNIWYEETEETMPSTNILSVFTNPVLSGKMWEFTFDESFMNTSGIDAQTVVDFLKVLDLEHSYSRPIMKVKIDSKAPLEAMTKMYNDMKDKFKPRKLKPNEIDFILQFLGPDDVSAPIPCCVTDIGVKLKKEFKAFLTQELMSEEYTPLAINSMARNIKLTFERSLIPPGATVGLTAAEALGGPVTQMALNSFHAPTSAKSTSTGVDAIKEIFNMSKNRKFKTSTIYFKNENLSFDEIIKMRIPIVEININTVIYTEKTVINKLAKLGGEQWWHKSCLESTNSEWAIDENQWVMRIFLNPEILYAYNLTSYKVAEALNHYNLAEQIIKAIPSPMLWSEGPVIDIVPNNVAIDNLTKYIDKQTTKGSKNKSSSRITNIEDLSYDLNFLNTVLRNTFDDNIIQGIKGIEQLFPASYNVIDTIKGQDYPVDFMKKDDFSKLDEKEAKKLNRKWKLNLDINQMIEKGISHQKVKILCNACDIKVLKIHRDYFEVEMPFISKPFVENPEDKKKELDIRLPKQYIIYKIGLDAKDKIQKEEAVRNSAKNSEDRLYIREKTDIERASKLMYGETNGGNTTELAKLPFVDVRRTHSNDFHEIFRLYGIEAIRQYLIRDLDSVIKEGRGYVLMRHIAHLMNYMTNLGSPVAISYTGMALQGKGTLASASYERPMEIFLRAAGRGRTENINSVSAAIFTGRQAKIGTGIINVAEDTAMAKELQVYLNNSNNIFTNNVDTFNMTEDELYQWDFEKVEEESKPDV